MRDTFGSHEQWRKDYPFEEVANRRSDRALENTGKKLIYFVISILLLIIGLAGILIPVIPGLLFLAAALFYFGKVSPVVKAWSDSHPVLGKVNDRMGQMGEVGILDRVKIAALMSAEAIATTFSALISFGKRIFK